MTIEEYTQLTGITPTNEALLTARIAKTQAILELLLGYTLDPEKVMDNHYVELGKTEAACSCWDINEAALQPPDEVMGAYRLFPYSSEDSYLAIDPASSVYAVKLVHNNITVKTLDPDDYCVIYKNGVAKYIEQRTWFCSCQQPCGCSQLAVDAEWLWVEDWPAALLDLWAEMINFYIIDRNIKSESLGSHSYTLSDSSSAPETTSVATFLLQQYAGPLGLMQRQRV